MSEGSEVRALHRAAELERPFAADLRHLSAEEAATALVDRFARTGYAQADVEDLVTVRRLIRRDCRQRSLKVQTFGVGAVVVAVDEERNSEWLASIDGIEYQNQMGDAALAALANVKLPHRRQ
jgi:ferric-dicitrate binding protein FerR (iron transport regulator)